MSGPNISRGARQGVCAVQGLMCKATRPRDAVASCTICGEDVCTDKGCSKIVSRTKRWCTPGKGRVCVPCIEAAK